MLLVLPREAFPQREASLTALDYLEDRLLYRFDEGIVRKQDILPALIVSVSPLYEESQHGYATAALQVLIRVFGNEGLRLCEACTVPRTFVTRGRIEQSMGAADLSEIIRIDQALRGNAQAARSAIWLDETHVGISLRIVDLASGRILLAETMDPELSEVTRSKRNQALVRELDRRARGESLTHTFIDVSMYPGQHFSLDWTEQWGETNANISGITLSLFNPILGVGGAYYRVIPDIFSILIGAKVLMSVPNALMRAVGGVDTGDVLDPLITGIFVLRIPIASSNFGVFFSVSTKGTMGFGVSSMNISVLPVLP